MNLPFPYHRTPTPFCPECPEVSLGLGLALFILTVLIGWALSRFANRER